MNREGSHFSTKKQFAHTPNRDLCKLQTLFNDIELPTNIFHDLTQEKTYKCNYERTSCNRNQKNKKKSFRQFVT